MEVTETLSEIAQRGDLGVRSGESILLELKGLRKVLLRRHELSNLVGNRVALALCRRGRGLLTQKTLLLAERTDRGGFENDDKLHIVMKVKNYVLLILQIQFMFRRSFP